MKTVLASSIAVIGAAISLSCFASPQEHPNNGNDPVVPAQENHRAPQGYARPPFHVHPNATATPSTTRTPANIRHVYGFDKIANQGAGQTIAIVDAYDHPSIESDLNTFSSAYSLPACTTANGCFKKIYASGIKPATDPDWALEIALDVEWAHAIAPQAKIMLVEAKSSSLNDLFAAVDTAVRNGASVVSMSFGGNEFNGQANFDYHFNVAGVTFVASSGDSGNGVEYPAASRNVVAVGGTTLKSDAYGNYIGETAWSGSGGGVSAYESEPAGQTAWPLPYTGKRGVPDVAYNADPSTGVPVYTSVAYNGQTGWFQMGGTSAGAPQWAALFAIANSARAAVGKGRLNATYNTLYTLAKAGYVTNYTDVTVGTNGTCGTVCNAAGSYDYVTGLGTPRADMLINGLVNY